MRGSQQLNKNNVARTRHLDIRYKWIINGLEMGYFTVRQISTTEITADGLMKLLMKTNYTKFMKLFGNLDGNNLSIENTRFGPREAK